MDRVLAKLNPLFFPTAALLAALGMLLSHSEWLAKREIWPDTWAGSLLLTPAYHLQKAQDSLALGQDDAAQAELTLALQKAPYWGSAWALQGYLYERNFGGALALPYYEQALLLDRFGRKTAELAVPPLWRAGWLELNDLLDRVLRLNSFKLAQLLPAVPPPSWPQSHAERLDGGNLEALLHAGQFRWLLAVERQGLSADYEAAQRAIVLAGVCEIEATQCLSLLAACEVGNPPCRHGSAITARLIRAASAAALQVGDQTTAVAWAKRALTINGDRALLQHAISVLEKTGHKEEARRIQRLHPALVDND